jgi:hypothetical protein
MSTLHPYSLSLLLSEGTFSCVKASEVLGFVSHDALTRSLKRTEQYARVIDWQTLPKKGTLIFDDTVIGKPHSEKIENVVWTWDSSEKRVTQGISFLLALWIAEGKTYLLSVVFPGTENRNDLVRQLMESLNEQGFEPERVLFDAWYAASETLNLLHGLGWTYASRIKGNRLFNGQALEKFRFDGARSRTGKMNGVKHKVQVVKHSDRYLLTNELTPHTSQTLEAVYEKRWVIETVFRALKHLLHLESCACRSSDAQLSHVLCCLEALKYLQQAFPGISLEAARQEMLHRYRCSNCRPDLTQLVTA